MDVKQEISALRAELKSRGITMRYFCKSAGITNAMIWKWSKGTYVPSMRSWMKVVDAADKIMGRK